MHPLSGPLTPIGMFPIHTQRMLLYHYRVAATGKVLRSLLYVLCDLYDYGVRAEHLEEAIDEPYISRGDSKLLQDIIQVRSPEERFWGCLDSTQTNPWLKRLSQCGPDWGSWPFHNFASRSFWLHLLHPKLCSHTWGQWMP